MTNEKVLTCPECGMTETAQVKRQLHIPAEIRMTVEEIHCSRCGYTGDNGDPTDAW